MERADLERLSKDELIELVLRLQRPEKTSRTSSKPPSTDRKERREQARRGLKAAVEHHDQGRRSREPIGHIGVHAQAARVGPKANDLL